MVVLEEFQLESLPSWPARWNLAPSQMAPVIFLGEGEAPREATSMRWGLIPSWAKEGKAKAGFINARLETAASKPSFREAWRHRRCLIASTGYYEWVRKGGPPTMLSRPGEVPFAFAGLWEPSAAREDDLGPSCTILTAPAAPVIEHIHERMPVMLSREQQQAWLTKGDAGPAARNSPELPFPLELRLVSARLNRVAEEGPHLLIPEDQAPQAPDTSPGLFD